MGKTLSPSGTGRRDPLRKQHRHLNAQIGKAFRAKLTPKQRLQALDRRLGAGKGARRERERLEKLIEESK